LGGHAGAGRGDPVDGRLDNVRAAVQGLGLPAGPAASTHPIAADIPDIEAVEVNFDGITYAKGASGLKQLVAYVGRENFLDAVRKYFAAHAWGNATLADLLAALEETSGRDLTTWSEQWLQTAGVNTLRPSYALDEDGRFTEFVVEQEAAASHPVLRSHRIAI